MQGEVVELSVSHQGLKNYVTQVQTVLNRYQARAEWLLKGEYGMIIRLLFPAQGLLKPLNKPSMFVKDCYSKKKKKKLIKIIILLFVQPHV